MNNNHDNKPRNTIIDYVFLYIAFAVFSISSIFSKVAATYPMFSAKFLFFYGMSLLVLAAYAFLWQRVLKRFKLSVAYANRPIVTLLGMLWGVLLFDEKMTWNMVLGAAIIVAGIWIVVTEHDE